jgi:hypothetical protein
MHISQAFFPLGMDTRLVGILKRVAYVLCQFFKKLRLTTSGRYAHQDPIGPFKRSS